MVEVVEKVRGCLGLEWANGRSCFEFVWCIVTEFARSPTNFELVRNVPNRKSVRTQSLWYDDPVPSKSTYPFNSRRRSISSQFGVPNSKFNRFWYVLSKFTPPKAQVMSRITTTLAGAVFGWVWELSLMTGVGVFYMLRIVELAGAVFGVGMGVVADDGSGDILYAKDSRILWK
jgi:hypothetical protein